MSAGNQTISGNLSVGGSLSTQTMTATNATVSNLSVQNLTVSGLGAAQYASVSATDMTTGELVATDRITTPSLFVGTANMGTAVSTLQADLDVAEAHVASLLTKTTNQTFSSGTGTTTFTGTVAAQTLTLAGNNVASQISDVQTKTQNIAATAGNTTVGGPATVSGLLTLGGGGELPAGQTLAVSGSISADGQTVAPAALGRISTLSSNAQNQLNFQYQKTFNITRSETTTSVSGTLSVQNLTVAGSFTAANALAAQSLNISGATATDSLAVSGALSAASATISGAVSAASVDVAGIVSPQYLVLRDKVAPTVPGQSIIYQDDQFLHIAHQTPNHNTRFACLDAAGVQKIPLNIHADQVTVAEGTTLAADGGCRVSYLAATGGGEVQGQFSTPAQRTSNFNGAATATPSTTEKAVLTQGALPSWNLATYYATNWGSGLAAPYQWAASLGSIVVPHGGAYTCVCSCPVGFTKVRLSPFSALTDTRQLVLSACRWVITDKATGAVAGAGTVSYASTGEAAVSPRTYTWNAVLGSNSQIYYKQYLCNIVFEAPLPYDAGADREFELHLDLGQPDVLIGYALNMTAQGGYSATSAGTSFWASAHVGLNVANAGAGHAPLSMSLRARHAASLSGSLETKELITQQLVFTGSAPPVSSQPFPSHIGGFITGSHGLQPIFCSASSLEGVYGSTLTNNDWRITVFPGWRFILYRHPTYSEEYPDIQRFDNTHGQSIISVPGSVRDLGSIRVYYRGLEITVGGIS